MRRLSAMPRRSTDPPIGFYSGPIAGYYMQPPFRTQAELDEIERNNRAVQIAAAEQRLRDAIVGCEHECLRCGKQPAQFDVTRVFTIALITFMLLRWILS